MGKTRGAHDIITVLEKELIGEASGCKKGSITAPLSFFSSNLPLPLHKYRDYHLDYPTKISTLAAPASWLSSLVKAVQSKPDCRR